MNHFLTLGMGLIFGPNLRRLTALHAYICSVLMAREGQCHRSHRETRKHHHQICYSCSFSGSRTKYINLNNHVALHEFVVCVMTKEILFSNTDTILNAGKKNHCYHKPDKLNSNWCILRIHACIGWFDNLYMKKLL